MDTPTPLEQALERLAAKDALIAELRADLDTARRETIATKAWGEGYQNALSLYFDKMGLNAAGSLDDRMAHVAKVCGASNALNRIAGLVGIGSYGDPDAIYLVVKDVRTARDDGRARVSELERDLAAKDKSLTTAHAALKRICEVIGAPVPACPADAVEAVKAQLGADSDAENRAKAAEQALKEIGSALCGSGCATFYDAGRPGGEPTPIPDAERIRILGERLRTERGEREQEALRAQRHADHLRDTHLALDDRGAPRHADGITLTPAARIRAIPC